MPPLYANICTSLEQYIHETNIHETKSCPLFDLETDNYYVRFFQRGTDLMSSFLKYVFCLLFLFFRWRFKQKISNSMVMDARNFFLEKRFISQ